MRQHVIYQQPRDLPGVAFAVRGWSIERGDIKPDQLAVPFASLEAAREFIGLISPNHVRIDRMPGDDPGIVEVWL